VTTDRPWRTGESCLRQAPIHPFARASLRPRPPSWRRRRGRFAQVRNISQSVIDRAQLEETFSSMEGQVTSKLGIKRRRLMSARQRRKLIENIHRRAREAGFLGTGSVPESIIEQLLGSDKPEDKS
jgi:hypothetical protein